MNKENILKVLNVLREKSKERKFEQSADLIINLKNFDIKKNSVNLFLNLPHKIKEKKIAAFLEKKSGIVDTITRSNFEKYKDKKEIKRLVKEYDFFISAASLMPSVATSFGKYLGPAGKMPNPQLGILKRGDEKEIQEVLKKVEKIIKIKSAEPSLKLCIGKEKMKDEEIAENISSVYNAVLNALPKKKENIKSVMVKFSMSKPVKIIGGEISRPKSEDENNGGDAKETKKK